MAKLDPVMLELGEYGEDGDRLVFVKYYRRVQRFFENKGLSPDESLDLTQETFLRIFRAEAEFDNRAQLEAWLFEIARNVLANALRDKATLKRSAAMISLDEHQPDKDLMGEQDALTSTISHEQLEIVQRALAELPEQMRQCVRLRLKDDLKHKEIAEILQIPVATVRSQLHQARERIRSMLEPHFGPIDF